MRYDNVLSAPGVPKISLTERGGMFGFATGIATATNTCRCSDRALHCRSHNAPLLNERHVILLKAVHHELVIPIGTTRIAPREGSIGPRSFDMGQQRVRRDAVRLRHPGELPR